MSKIEIPKTAQEPIVLQYSIHELVVYQQCMLNACAKGKIDDNVLSVMEDILEVLKAVSKNANQIKIANGTN